MGKRLCLLGALLMLLVVVPAPPAGAAKPMDVTIDVAINFSQTPALPTGTFTASGDAVTNGLMCASGTHVAAQPEKFTGYQSGRIVNIQVFTEFTCGDNTGEAFAGEKFLIKFQVHMTPTGFLASNWTLVSGTGPFADLRGTGHGTGQMRADHSGTDEIYTGGLH